jgi:glycosyltransferase involved in cell wall biosynthesis
VAIMGDDTLYFLKTGRFSPRASAAIRRALTSYDALLCVGEMNTSIAHELLPTKVFTVHPVWESSAHLAAGASGPRLDDESLVFVGHGPSARRGWYKGVDLLLEAFARVLDERPSARLAIAGVWDTSYVDTLTVPAGASFVGPVDDVSTFMASASLYVHLGRGEAFGMSILEAMAAGVPCIVSEWTGAAEAVRQVDARLVVPLDAAVAADRIGWYLGLSPEEKRRLSVRTREVAATYSDDRALTEFREALVSAS